MNSTKSLLSDLRIEGKARRTKRSFPIRLVLIFFLVTAGAFVWWRTQIWAPEVRTVIATASDTGPKTVLNASGHVVAAVYLAPGNSAVLGDLPDVSYRPEYAVGELWSRACNSFAAGMRAQRFPYYATAATLSSLVIPPDRSDALPPEDISDAAFEGD